ncbi:hypothetical protein MKX03_016540, partial [Papaver bracteatum]
MGGDARNWDEESYRKSILKEREIQSRTVFRTVFAPSSSQNPEYIVLLLVMDLLLLVLSLLVSLIMWNTILNSGCQEIDLKPILDLVNPQHKGPWGSLSPIPENNALAIDYQGDPFSQLLVILVLIVGMWNETSQIKMVFRGHTDYLHCIVARNSSNQIITGSEDGSMRIWDCRNGKCVNIIEPKQMKSKEAFPWISCIGLDSSESWLACGSGRSLSGTFLPLECISRIET